MSRFQHPARRTAHATPLRPVSLAIHLILAGAALGGSALIAPAMAQTAAAPAAATHSYDIPAGPLQTALMRFASESGVYLAGSTDLAKGKTSTGLKGTYTVEGGLSALLAGTGLEAAPNAKGQYVLKSAVPADAASDAHGALPIVTITGAKMGDQPTEKSRAYTGGTTSSGSKMALSQRETPQSMSVVTRAQLDDFNLSNIEDALAQTTGVTVEKFETDRTIFTSRGFDITNFQFDGVGVPFTYGTQYGDVDTALYDRIEVVRGADGLAASTGNPSATVNFIRKRPTYDFQASGNVSYGSWDTKRIDADVSGPLNSAGTVAGRFVAVHEDGNSYLDRYKPSKNVFYGVIEAAVTDSTQVTLGYSLQRNHDTGTSWGGLPLLDSNGKQIDYDVSTSVGADWAFFNTQEGRAFAEVAQQLGSNWTWKTTVDYNRLKSNSAMFYPVGSPDFSTGTGFTAYTMATHTTNNQVVADSNLSGRYELFGRKHDLVGGLSWSRSHLYSLSHYGDDFGDAVSTDDVFNGSEPEPVFNNGSDLSDYLDVRRTVYLSTRLNLRDDLKLLVGANHTQADSSGVAAGVSKVQHESGNSPYVGVVYDLTSNLSAYASFTKIFSPQSQTDYSGATLAPATGRNMELGFKSDFLDKRLNVSGAVFRTKQTNIAEGVGYVGTRYYYEGINAKSQGGELEVAGEILPGWKAIWGATVLRIVDDNGDAARTYVPRRSMHLGTTWVVPGLEHKLTVGANMRWQSAIHYDEVKQSPYAVVGLMARYDITPKIGVSANLDNVFNEKYLSSLYYERANYGTPFQATVNLSVKY
jgi:outer-membrane receptor for ferric coprogen and ferric-rhodotorulic acid